MEFGRSESTFGTLLADNEMVEQAIKATGATAVEIGSVQVSVGLPAAFDDCNGKVAKITFLPQKPVITAHKGKKDPTKVYKSNVLAVMATHPISGEQHQGVVNLTKKEVGSLFAIPNWTTQTYETIVLVTTADGYTNRRGSAISFNGKTLNAMAAPAPAATATSTATTGFA